MTVADASADDSTVELAVRPAGSTATPTRVTNLSVGAGKATTVLGSTAGTRTSIAWDSIAAFGVANQSVEVVATATDRFGLAGKASATINVRNDTPPEAQILSIGTASGVAEVAGRIPIRFALFDAEADSSIDPSSSNARVDVTIEVSGDGGTTWSPATGLVLTVEGRRVGLPSLKGLAASATTAAQSSLASDPANVHTFIWDALADGFGPGQRNVQVRITPRNSQTGFLALASRRLGDAAPLFDSSTYPIAGVEGVATGDFNGDGIPDLLIAHLDQTVGLRFGLGDGTFAPETLTPVLAAPERIVVGDFNGDGNLDFVTTGGEGSGLVLGYGDGSGNFTLSSYNVPAGETVNLHVADVDGDGHADLITSGTQGNLFIMSGASPGTFGTTLDTQGLIVTTFAIGDVNGDRIPDIVAVATVPATLTASSFQELFVFPGLGAGAFGPATVTAITDAPAAIAIGDLDGDGFGDVVAADGTANSLTIRFGSAAGLGAPITVPVPGGPDTLALGDVDGDGRLDIVVGANTSQEVVLVRGLDHRTFAAGLRVPDLTSSEIHLADLQGRGRLDVLSVAQFLGVVVHRNEGGVGVGAEARLVAGPFARNVVLGDLNGDGILDQVVRNDDSVTVRLGGVGASFGDPITVPLESGFPRLGDVALGDLDGDGKLDLVETDVSASVPSGRLVVRLGNGDGPFGPEISYGTTDARSFGAEPASLALGDVNGDGLLDVVVVEPTTYVAVYLNTGGGVLATPTIMSSGGTYSYACSLADLDRDGNLDLVISGSITGSLGVFKGDGKGGFAAPVFFTGGGADIFALAVPADIGGDGWVDLVCSNGQILRNLGGVLAAVPSVGGQGTPVVGDLDGDGLLDAAWPDGTILVDESGRARLTDFGIGKAADEGGLTATGSALGTPHYMSPEQLEDAKRAGPPADVYGLGGLLYFVLTEGPPHRGESLMQLLREIKSGQLVAPRRVNPSVPAELEALCLRCLAHEPGQRPDAKATAAALEKWLASG